MELISPTENANIDCSAPATAPPRMTGERYKPQLDGIRAFCIIFTLLNHIPGKPWWINGTIGVDIFFALSGWLITWLIFSETAKRRSVNLVGFYTRRVFRIAPLYFFVIFIYYILTSAGAKTSGGREFSTAFPFMVTFNMEYRPVSAGNLFGQAWTLGIEEKFYLVWPLIIASTLRRPLIGALAAGGCVALLWIGFGANDMVIRGYMGLGAGAAVAALTHKNERLADWWHRTPLATVLFSVIILLYLGSIFRPSPTIWNVSIALCAAGGVASLWLNENQPVARLLTTGCLPWLGRLTYAIYLLQAIIIRLVEAMLNKLGHPLQGVALFPFVYLGCVGAAWIVHVGIEDPMIRRGKAMAKKWSR